MAELYIYSESGLLAVVENATSVRWRRKFFEPGEIEIHAPATAENIAYLAKGNFVRRPEHVEAAIIEEVTIADYEITVTGRMMSSMMDRAIVSQTYNFSGTYEAAMLALVAEAARCVTQITAGASKGLAGDVSAQVTYKNVLTVEEKFSKASGHGFRVDFTSPTVWTFECYDGVDHSIAQSMNPIVYFSDEFGNLVSPNYQTGFTNYKNFAYVGGEGEGSSRTIVTVDQRSGGENRREIFVDAKDLSSENLTTEAYQAALQERGIEALADAVETESFEADGVDVENFKYREDWDLGDIVTVQYKRLGLSSNLRVTEVEEVIEKGVETVTPTFGTPLPETLNLEGD